MCGICGIGAENSSAPVDGHLLTAMNHALSHRGPDGTGHYVENGVGLGHKRLSIIDLAGGDQPIYNEDKSVCIVFNGEIYNYKELREDLVARGHGFYTSSDTEVIVHLYEEYGPACVERLNGMFAFAIWDKNTGKLFCARDRFGEKPFYYAVHKGQLYFSSELKSLKLIDGLDESMDLSALDDYLSYGYIPAPKTIYSSVRKLPQAHTLTWQEGKLEIERYWEPAFPSISSTMSYADAVAELGELIRDSIRLRLRSDVPVGAFLSGGIDSSLMVAFAAEQAGSALSTFSVGFAEQDFSELGYARMIADRYATNHHEIMVEDLDLGLFPKIVEHFDEPFGDPSAIPTYYVTQAAASHLKVCISGDAGDELFCGYERYRPEPLERQFDMIPPALRRPALNFAASLLPDHVRGKGRLRRFAESGHLRYHTKMAAFDVPERLRLFRPELAPSVDRGAALFAPYFRGNGLDPISRYMHADQNTYLSDDILVKVDRNSMWHGLEVRVPFLDHRICDFANSLPLQFKSRGGVQKRILKDLLRDKVPAEVAGRGKKGFGLPLVHWLRERFESYSRDLLLSSDSRILEYFRPEVVRGFVSGHQKGSRDLSRRVWTLMWLEQWCRTNEA